MLLLTYKVPKHILFSCIFVVSFFGQTPRFKYNQFCDTRDFRALRCVICFMISSSKALSFVLHSPLLFSFSINFSCWWILPRDQFLWYSPFTHVPRINLSFSCQKSITMHFEIDGSKFKLQSVRTYFLIYMGNGILFRSV